MNLEQCTVLNNIVECKEIISSGNYTIDEALEALTLAIEMDTIEIVSMLLCIDDVIENITYDDNLVLKLASEFGNIEVVKMLLEIDSVKQNAATNNNEALRVASERGYIEIVKELLEIDSVKQNAAAENNEALRLASENGHIEVVKELLEIDSVIDGINVWNMEAYVLAVKNGHNELAELLLENSLLSFYELITFLGIDIPDEFGSENITAYVRDEMDELEWDYTDFMKYRRIPNIIRYICKNLDNYDKFPNENAPERFTIFLQEYFADNSLQIYNVCENVKKE